ncbi:L-amino-acid oxidase [Sphaerodactylus townsendi]|uniref:L-amino-acid oxidase n=1 Tax=Sphaerodactylus townsendi TaxID=933632 RepID=UPI002027130D|nr:L-amino-acid oxidase [Sphaerodactylus townsendi]
MLEIARDRLFSAENMCFDRGGRSVTSSHHLACHATAGGKWVTGDKITPSPGGKVLTCTLEVSAVQIKSESGEAILSFLEGRVTGFTEASASMWEDEAQTYRNYKEGWYANLGPMRLNKENRIVREYIKQLGLQMSEFGSSNSNNLYYVNNIRKRASEVNKKPSILGYHLKPEEEGKSARQLYSFAIKKVIEEVQRTNCSYLFQKYDSYSTRQYLIEVANLSHGAVQMIGVLLNHDNGYYQSFVESLKGEVFAHSKGSDELVGGIDLLPRALYKTISNRVVLNARVVSITQKKGAVTAVYKTPRQSSSVTADYAILTPTTKATRRIYFDPPLSANKSNALRAAYYRSATKVFLGCSKKFWEAEGIYGGQSVTDRPSRFINYMSRNFSRGFGVLLASYVTSEDSTFFLSLSHEEILNIVFDDLSVVHQLPKEKLRRICNSSVIKRWDLDQYAMGGYVRFIPYQFTEFAKPLRETEGRLYFAGEHTTVLHGWIDSAMATGLRAARAINLL